MYHSSFGLSEPPFSIAVDPRYLFMSGRHRDALAHLLYGVGVGGGFILLTGEVGTGKTTIIRCLLQQLPETTDLALVLNPALDARQLLATVCDELGLSTDADDLKSLTDHLHRFLLDNHQRGRNTVLLIDEAQHLDAGVLEQVRLLTNLETNTRKLLQIVLVGQPELKEKLARPELRQLSQRITARFELQALDARETAAYIEHRLQVGGLHGQQCLFSRRILARIHRASAGIPRLINIICDRALLGCYARKQGRVDRQMLRQAVREVKGVTTHGLSPHERIERLYPMALAGLVLATSITVLWWVGPGRGEPESLYVASRLVPDAHQGSPSVLPVLEQVVAQNPEPESERVPPSASTAWSFEQDSAALGLLLSWQGHVDAPVAKPCNELAGRGLRCELLRVDGWSDLQSYRVPALLELRDGATVRWVIVLNLAAGEALVLGHNGEQRWPEATLGEYWTGRALVPWLVPPGYRHPLRKGSYGQAVSWLAQAFATLDDQHKGLAELEYNELLERRVRLFQREQALFVDGVAGFRTLLRLQQTLAESAENVDMAMLGKGEG